MVAPLKVGIAGLGTVGAEVIRQIEREGRVLAQRCGRGVRVPGIERLLPTPHKQAALHAMTVAAAALVAATLWPARPLAVLAGAAWLPAWALVAIALGGVQRRAERFVRALACAA